MKDLKNENEKNRGGGLVWDQPKIIKISQEVAWGALCDGGSGATTGCSIGSLPSNGCGGGSTP
jgi:SynChlorMet cassette protein ScmA